MAAVGATSAAGLAGCAGRLTGSSADSAPSYSQGTDANSEWAQPDYDARATAYNPDAAVPREDVSVRWDVELPSRPAGRPVVADGTGYVATAASLVAYDLADDTEQWQVGDERGQAWPAAPVVHDGVVYVGMLDSTGPTMRALDAADGSELWTYDVRGDVEASPVADVSEDGELRALYVGDDTGRVYRLAPTAGRVDYHRDVFGRASKLSLGARGQLFVGTGGGELYAFYDDGDRLQGLWRRKLAGKVTDAAATPSGVYAATFGGPLYSLRSGAHAGSNEWTVDAGANTLAVTGHEVVGYDGGGLDVRSDDTGDRRWGVDGGTGTAPAIAGDTLVAGRGEIGEGGSGVVTAYGMDGDERWTFETEDAIVGGVTVADGAVVAGTQGVDAPAKLYVLDPA